MFETVSGNYREKMTGIWQQEGKGKSVALSFSSVQSLSHVRLFSTPWTAALTLAAQLVCSSVEGLFCFKKSACPISTSFLCMECIGFLGFSVMVSFFLLMAFTLNFLVLYRGLERKVPRGERQNLIRK